MELDLSLFDLLVELSLQLYSQSFEFIFLPFEDLFVLVLFLLLEPHSPLLHFSFLSLLQGIPRCFGFLVVSDFYQVFQILSKGEYIRTELNLRWFFCYRSLSEILKFSIVFAL